MAALPSFFNKLAVLKQIPIFQGLNWFELNRIARKATLVEYNKGDVICQQEAPADAFYALVSGRIYSYTLNSAGPKEEVDFILRRLHFGIISALTGENHSHNYEAINDCVVIKINKDDFADLLKSIAKLAVGLSQSLSHRIRSHVTHTRSTQENMIIAVYAPVKGSGSSTYAVNLALGLKSQTDKNVLLLSISSDPNDPFINLEDIIGDNDKINSSIIKGRADIDILPVKFDKGNTTLVNRISQFVSAPTSQYVYVVVDLPNEMDDVVSKTLSQADKVHLISIERAKDLQMTRTVIDRLMVDLKGNFHTDKVQVILSGIHDENALPAQEVHNILNYDMFALLPHLKLDQFKSLPILENFNITIVEPASEYGFIIHRLARHISGSLIGLVLGGGAALGMAHIGVIRVLEQEGIPVDVVVGSSMGALIASIWSIGNSADQLEKYGREFEKITALSDIYDPILPISGLVGGYGIRKWLRSKLKDKTFIDTKIPLRVVAYDLYHRHETAIDSGDLVDAVSKSIAIPGVIRPIMENDQMIIDGGVLNPLPTNVLVDMGVKKIIAVNVLQSPSEASWGHSQKQEELKQQYKIAFTQHPLKFIGFRIGRFFAKAVTPNIADIIVRTLQASEYVIAEQSAKRADVLIHPDLRGINWFELYKVNTLIKRGEESTIKALPAIKALVKK